VARKRKRKEREAEAGFSEVPVAADEERQRLAPVDVQEKVFRLAFRGYSERDVDEFLDRITEDLAALHEENKRLREHLAEGGGSPGAFQEAEQQAEGIVRQAREHAARLIEDAEARAAEGSMVGAAELPTSFLLRERQFLQQMAALIQDHARRLKEEARRASSRDESAPAPPPPPPPEPASGTEGVPSAATSGSTRQSPGSTEQPTSAPEPVSEPEPDQAIVLPEAGPEATAPWSQVDPGAEPEEGPAGERDQDQDPLLSAWESAFTGEGEGETETPGDDATLYPSEVRNRKDDEGEPSLRELFWGDEG
jgi:DivIVA domain-containing protein